MSRRERGKLGGPFGYAIPSLNEVEGRMLVARVVATVSLQRLLKHHDGKGKAALLGAFRRTIERKVKYANFTEADTVAATKYAQGLFDEALALANGNGSVDNR